MTMATVHFTSQLERFLSAPTVDAAGATLAEVLAGVFRSHPKLKSYVVDDQGAVRRHVAVFVDGAPVADRQRLTDTVRPDSEIHIFQALSGG